MEMEIISTFSNVTQELQKDAVEECTSTLKLMKEIRTELTSTKLPYIPKLTNKSD